MRSLVLAGCVLAAALSPGRAADAEANKEFYRHYMEDIWIKHDQSAVERLVLGTSRAAQEGAAA